MRDFLAPSHLEDHAVEVVASDLMTSPALACRANSFFEEIAESLAEKGPFVRDLRLIGVVTRSFDWGPYGHTYGSVRPSSSCSEVHNMG